MSREIIFNFGQNCTFIYEEGDTADTILDKMKESVRELLYSNGEFLQFVVDDCPDFPELVDEMLD